VFGVIIIKTLATFTYCRKKKGENKLRLLRASALFLVWLTITGGVFLSGSPVRGEVSQPATVIVNNGDTLWGLAKNHAPRGIDIRHYLDEVLQKNGLTNMIIYPGQEIILP